MNEFEDEEHKSWFISDIQKRTPLSGWSYYQTRAYIFTKLGGHIDMFTTSFLRVGCTGRVLSQMVYGNPEGYYVDPYKYISMHGIVDLGNGKCFSPTRSLLFSSLIANIKQDLKIQASNWMREMQAFSNFHLGHELNQNNFFDSEVIFVFFIPAISYHSYHFSMRKAFQKELHGLWKTMISTTKAVLFASRTNFRNTIFITRKFTVIPKI